MVYWLTSSTIVFADDQIVVDAQKLFKQFTDMERTYDPALADLIAPTALIKDTRVYQEGPNKTYNWNGDTYKMIIKAQLPIAKARGEQFAYSLLTYTREGNNVRIKGNKANVQKKVSFPFEMLVGASGKNAMKILEENFQNQP